MKRLLRPWALALAVPVASATLAASPAPTAEQVRPIEVGTRIPEVAVLDAAGESSDLRAILAGRPAAVVFYRGGW